MGSNLKSSKNERTPTAISNHPKVAKQNVVGNTIMYFILHVFLIHVDVFYRDKTVDDYIPSNQATRA